jgi:hypothetical protein
VAGVDHVGIGSDYDGVDRSVDELQQIWMRSGRIHTVFYSNMKEPIYCLHVLIFNKAHVSTRLSIQFPHRCFNYYRRADNFRPVSFIVSAWEWVYATNLSRLQR